MMYTNLDGIFKNTISSPQITCCLLCYYQEGKYTEGNQEL